MLFCLEKFEGNLGQWLWIVGVLVVVVGSNGVYSASFGFQVLELFWVFNFFGRDMRSRRFDLIYLNVVI